MKCYSFSMIQTDSTGFFKNICLFIGVRISNSNMHPNFFKLNNSSVKNSLNLRIIKKLWHVLICQTVTKRKNNKQSLLTTFPHLICLLWSCPASPPWFCWGLSWLSALIAQLKINFTFGHSVSKLAVNLAVFAKSVVVQRIHVSVGAVFSYCCG